MSDSFIKPRDLQVGQRVDITTAAGDVVGTVEKNTPKSGRLTVVSASGKQTIGYRDISRIALVIVADEDEQQLHQLATEAISAAQLSTGLTLPQEIAQDAIGRLRALNGFPFADEDMAIVARGIVAELAGPVTASSIGIPYARAEVVDGQLIHICPVCDEHIAESTDPDGETTTSNYAAHYAEKHEGDRDELAELRAELEALTDKGKERGWSVSEGARVNELRRKLEIDGESQSKRAKAEKAAKKTPARKPRAASTGDSSERAPRPGTSMDGVIKVLRDASEPMKPDDIFAEMKRRRLHTSLKGKTPVQTIAASLNVAAKNGKHGITRPAPGRFAVSA